MIQFDIQLQNLIMGGLAALGAIAYVLWYFLQVYKAAKASKEKEVFSPIKALMTVAPSLLAGFLAGYYMDPTSIVQVVPIILAGWGAADLGSELGLNTFFDPVVEPPAPSP